jgi:hypothetical protein
MREEAMRETARREHRTIALLGVLQCWICGWDGIVFQREVLQQVLHLEHFKDARVQWLKDDIKAAFPHVGRITASFTVTTTGTNAATLDGNLSGGHCPVPIAVKGDGTLTFATRQVCSQTNPYGGYVYGGSGTWDYGGHLAFSDTTGDGVHLYYDETFAGHK